jgi:hypothetical protein
MQLILKSARRPLAGLLLLTSGAVPGEPAGITAGLLVYRVEEPGSTPHISRILVTPEYLRLDQGGGPEDTGFALYDRGQQTIYSVDHEAQHVLRMQATGNQLEPPADLRLSERPFEPGDAPELSGGRPVGYQLFANDQLCTRLIAAPNLMSDALEGLREFRVALAEQQAAGLVGLPPEMTDPCDLAIHVYAPVRDLQYGLPLEVADPGGRQLLADFKPEFAADPELFRLPEGYRRLSMEQIRGSLGL